MTYEEMFVRDLEIREGFRKALNMVDRPWPQGESEKSWVGELIRIVHSFPAERGFNPSRRS